MVIIARRLPIFSCSAAKEAVKMIKWQISPSPSLSHSFSLSSSISSWVLPLLWPLLLTNVRIYLGKYYSLQLLQCGAPLMVLAKTALIKNQIDFMESQQFLVCTKVRFDKIFIHVCSSGIPSIKWRKEVIKVFRESASSLWNWYGNKTFFCEHSKESPNLSREVGEHVDNRK